MTILEQAAAVTTQPTKRTSTPDSSKAGLITLNYNNLLLLFVIGSVAGLAIEVLYHFALYGEYQSRAGLVWGPFSPLYGVGAILLTLALNWLCHHPGPVLFVVSALTGSIVEFICSWWMETCFGAIAWDYSGTFLNIDGRVNLFFACMWGALGLLWARFVMPTIHSRFSGIDWKQPALKASTLIVTLFLLINITFTVQAFDRESERALGLPASSNHEQFLDENFSTEWMATRFENMSIYGASR